MDDGAEICGSPYLTWHHFDPPWRFEQHHRPEGMIALCREHADKADNGSFTDDQLRRLKADGRGRGREISGRFDWMRRELLAVVGGNAYLRTPVLIKVAEKNVVWFGRNPHDELLLNFNMPTLSGLQRASIRNNTWIVQPEGVSELICPPSGKQLSVRYANGDKFEAKYRVFESRSELQAAYKNIKSISDLNFELPATVTELTQVASGSYLQLSPGGTTIGAGGSTSGVAMSDGRVGISIATVAPITSRYGNDAISTLLARARGLPGYSNG